jgi:hypothetical protein
MIKTIANKSPGVGAKLSYNSQAVATKRAAAAAGSKIQHKIDLIFKK